MSYTSRHGPRLKVCRVVLTHSLSKTVCAVSCSTPTTALGRREHQYPNHYVGVIERHPEHLRRPSLRLPRASFHAFAPQHRRAPATEAHSTCFHRRRRARPMQTVVNGPPDEITARAGRPGESHGPQSDDLPTRFTNIIFSQTGPPHRPGAPPHSGVCSWWNGHKKPTHPPATVKLEDPIRRFRRPAVQCGFSARLATLVGRSPLSTNAPLSTTRGLAPATPPPPHRR